MAARAEGSAVAHPRNFKLTTLLRDTGHVLAGFARVPRPRERRRCLRTLAFLPGLLVFVGLGSPAQCQLKRCPLCLVAMAVKLITPTTGNQEETHSNKGGLAFLTSAPHFVSEVTDLL